MQLDELGTCPGIIRGVFEESIDVDRRCCLEFCTGVYVVMHGAEIVKDVRRVDLELWILGHHGCRREFRVSALALLVVVDHDGGRQ